LEPEVVDTIEPSKPERMPDLRELTDARVALGRHGSGLPTRAQLAFLLDHARAREAVWTRVDQTALEKRLVAAGLGVARIESMAGDRSIYVRRPDLGRQLSSASLERLKDLAIDKPCDLVIVVADGLSSSAVELNALPLIEALQPRIADLGLVLGPIVLADQARVALGDPVGESLKARVTIVLIGERPGLSAADSLGAYVTYEPRTGTPDSRRNCVSNIRDGGLSASDAAQTITMLVRDMLRTAVSGVHLKSALDRLSV
jgi:ethanolamine ammonia-lyase small subunit